MKSRTTRNEHLSTRIGAVISACMLVVLGLPACTAGALPSARSTVQDEPSAIRQQISVAPSPEPLVFRDETSKSLPVQQTEGHAGACSDAPCMDESMASGYEIPIHEEEDESCINGLYWTDEPLASQMQRTSAADLEQMCADQKSACMTRCLNNPKPPYPAQKKGDRAHFALCHKRCFKAFMDCIRKAGLLQEFSVLDAAMAWVKSHGKEIVGTIVVIGGIVYIVSTAGSGALVLVVL